MPVLGRPAPRGAPVLPGETLRTELWQDGAEVSFQTWVAERAVLALSHGRAVLRV